MVVIFQIYIYSSLGSDENIMILYVVVLDFYLWLFIFFTLKEYEAGKRLKKSYKLSGWNDVSVSSV